MAYDIWSIDDVARQYIGAELCVLPIPRREKGCRIPGWQNLRTTADQVDSFFRPGDGIAVLMGAASGGLVDLDLDHPSAVALADQYLPATGAMFGRASKPRSHRIYITDDTMPPQKFCGLDRLDGEHVLVEYRTRGWPTVFPPSEHPSGEVISWASGGPPARVDAMTLVGAAQRLADAVCAHMDYRPGRARPPVTNQRRRNSLRGLVRDDEHTIRRARAYVAKCPPSVSGRGGHKAAFRVACVLMLRFGLSRATAERIMNEWNRRCQPPWSDAELSHKLDDAEQSDGEHDDLRTG